jgi:hypothetical protein
LDIFEARRKTVNKINVQQKSDGENASRQLPSSSGNAELELGVP